MALEGKKIPHNPHAAELANRYVALIRRQCGWSHEKTTELPQKDQETTKELPKNFQETEKDWDLSEEDIAALEEIPL